MRYLFFIIAISGLLLSSCKHQHTHDLSDHEEHTDQKVQNSEHSGAIIFTKTQAEKIDFETDFPSLEPVGQVIKTTAQILSDQTDETIIVAHTSGIVIFSGKNISEGENIGAGQKLFSISGSDMADNNVNIRMTEAQSNYTKAEADYLRAQDLAKDKIVSDKEFRQIKSAYETSKAIYDNLNKNFSGNGQQVVSPTNGFLKQLLVSNGQFVEAGQALVSISKNKSLLLKADVQSKYAPLLPFITSANIRKMGETEGISLESLNGKVLSFGKSTNENDYFIPVTFQIDNKVGFISGSFVEMYIKTKSEKTVLTLPKKSLTENQGTFFVFVEVSPELYEKREVKTGISDGIRIEIISGITQQDRVVTKGAISVKLAEASGNLDAHAGHVH